MTNKDQFTQMLKVLFKTFNPKVGEVAEKLGVHKDTVTAWKGSNEKRHISEKTATKLLPILDQMLKDETPDDQAPEETQTDRFEVFKPDHHTITVKQLAEILGVTPKSLRRCLRKKYGKTQDGTWTLTLRVVEEMKEVFKK